MKASSVRAVFDQLREHLVPMVQAITAQSPADVSCLQAGYPQQDQEAFFVPIVRALGFDYERGRHDVSAHPFTTNFSIGDVRITVRFNEHDLGEALFSAMHEAGHAMYEQGSDPNYEATPLAGGTSSGVHESQSRLWENIVGRSKGFWTHYYPKLQDVFPAQLGGVPLDAFYRAINAVRRSLIRTDADEVTYNLHVMLRFGLELDLLEGKLAVRDLPEAWRERFKADLGITPPDDRDGVLQDVHWYSGSIGGAFQGYTLGNILSVQFYDTALKAHPEIPDEIAAGRFGALYTWLVENVYRPGSKFTANELVERVTGEPLTVTPYVNYLQRKYGELYDLS
jgi:carboxypeptidase Taq